MNTKGHTNFMFRLEYGDGTGAISVPVDACLSSDEAYEQAVQRVRDLLTPDVNLTWIGSQFLVAEGEETS